MILTFQMSTMTGHKMTKMTTKMTALCVVERCGSTAQRKPHHAQVRVVALWGALAPQRTTRRMPIGTMTKRGK